jgi:uncharacterized cupin superfamily protein
VLTKTEEAPLRREGTAMVPDGEGWFIVNVAEAHALHTDRFGDGALFEAGLRDFPEFGINVRVLQPGQPAAMYHRESNQEAFLVLSGECVAVVEDEERPMRKGDFMYAPPGTAHVIVGAGDGPCSILMVGARDPSTELTFPASEAATRHGASVDEDTDDRSVAYAGVSPPEPRPLGDIPW